MEQLVRSTCVHALTVSPNVQALASARSLIINLSSSDSTLSSLLETLARFLELHGHHHPHLLHHALTLLADLVHRHSIFSPLVFDLVRKHSLLDGNSTRLVGQSLSLLATVANLDRSLVPAMDEIGEGLFLSMCFRPSVSVRLCMLFNAERFRVRPSVLLTVFLGFTKDPYPYVRRLALDGLVGLCKSMVLENRGFIEGCYSRAVELLYDVEDCIRSAAIRAVIEWGLKFVELHAEASRGDWSDVVFIQVCSMVRDMSMKVRVEAFDALGRIGMVSEDILLQTLSKKVLGIIKEKKYFDHYSKELQAQTSGFAGVFVHGLEDEFYEVRRSACHALQSLTLLSTEFAGESINLLTNVLNDDSIVVRLQALETMHHMAACDSLKVQEIHMHMFLSSLVDNSTLIRSGARKILRLIHLPNFDMFKSCIDGLQENLEMYPQDEADVLSVLFKIGQMHGNFVLCIIKDTFPEIEPSCQCKIDFDSPKVVSLIMLAISAPLSHEEPPVSIPPILFSYAVTFLGRISHALSDVMSQSTLLAYFSNCSRSTISSAAEFDTKEEDIFLNLSGGDLLNCRSDQIATSPVECPLTEHDEITESINFIFSKVMGLWPLIQSGCMGEVLRTLRNCKEELARFTMDSLGCAALAFTSKYLRVVKLLGSVWQLFLPPTKILSCRMGHLDLLLGKLDRSLTEMRNRFIGLSKEEELHVLELILIACILRLSKAGICCQYTTLKMYSTISHVKFLCKEGSIQPSDFVIEVEKLLSEVGVSTDEVSESPFLFKRLLDFFSLKRFVFGGSLKHIKAELDVPGYDSVNPLPFISGLPVGIPFEITLYNVLSKSILWLKMTLDKELTQFVFLDHVQYGDSSEVRKFKFVAPFYRTPRAISFKMRVFIGVECVSEEVCFVKRCGGPKHQLACISHEKEVYLSMLKRD
ncbi:protein SIEL [Malania oleifera]|uniref:protein SIEL n=1 Tax=Malania oleifera TaxID=397392 RepID=UPI0025ADEB62|nr:protein SIEL [Malania oleifera]XP_057953513.1 protein SIEL [Malania oleifera]XP_057953514.1 protein SIEL [Malania oleifera]